jgi:predicted ATPase
VTGEPGIGKTTLVDAFTSGLTTNEPIVAARGQCIEQYGAGAAFLPIIDALEQLCRSADGEAAIASLRRLAPSWLIDLPTLISPQERESLMHQCFGVTPERRLREITAFFEQTGQDRMVVLVLEDLPLARSVNACVDIIPGSPARNSAANADWYLPRG